MASDKAPSAVGPYSQVCAVRPARRSPTALGLTGAPTQAIKSNGMLYMSGSVGLVPTVRAHSTAPRCALQFPD